MSPEIQSSFPFDSQYAEVKGSKMHYVDVGSGDPILFLHGNPTSSYLWRNVLPHLQDQGRCIAPDLIGMGRSDKPEIGYTFEEHYAYLRGFIEELGLENLTLVVHDWGSGLGFHYANDHPDNVRAVAFMEALYRPWTYERMPRQFELLFRLMRTPVAGWLFVSVANGFVTQLLPGGVERSLSDAELARYAEPYPTVASRKPVLQWPREVPIGGTPGRVHEKVVAYNDWLESSAVPKLCLYADPGLLIQDEDVAYIEREFPNTTTVDVGEGTHYLQEDAPDRIGEAIADWHADL